MEAVKFLQIIFLEVVILKPVSYLYKASLLSKKIIKIYESYIVIGVLVSFNDYIEPCKDLRRGKFTSEGP